MVNFVAAEKQLVHGVMKMAGLRPKSVEIEPGTVMNFWAPSSSKRKKHEEVVKKGVVVLVHGFAADGIFTWQFQVGALTRNYDVYIPDLLFFGGSTTSTTDRSPAFQAQCLAKALQGALDIHSCVVIGFSYGGFVAFNMAHLYPSLVSSLVISGSVTAMTDSITQTIFQRLGFSSFSDLLLPSDVKGVKKLLSVGAKKNIWLPNRLYRDFLKVMFTNRKERGELLDGLVISDKDATIPNFSQTILLLWGDNDQIFDIELAKNMKEQLGDKATLQRIKKAGHLVHLERPCVYNKYLKEFLALSVQANRAK
ncbi:uncharacterized protein LOC131237975 [Magnolia sinica]|uniref:uncharacterized protein LOC131237975 n=1 Tax=Magnolia sinica TaxID=86752 RepID=UPI0026594A4E|nr:uncharacterized protein LOC131237975 [Magnolia sinica]